MHIVKINGGLGNQMFQYAFALVLEDLYGEARLDLGWIRDYADHNGYELGRLFAPLIPECGEADRRRVGDVSESLFGKARRRLRLTKGSQYRPRGSGYDARALTRAGDTYYAGYWQSYRYFAGREKLIRDAFAFVPPLSPRNAQLLSELSGRATIGVHVRRGDFLGSASFGGVCDLEYYRRAIAAAAEGATDPLFLVFSDDLAWCRAKLPIPGEALFVDWNGGDESYADMRLMTRCDRLVIANSSFSWWGAWLGQRPCRLVIAPPRWFGGKKRDNLDIVPPEWTRMPEA